MPQRLTLTLLLLLLALPSPSTPATHGSAPEALPARYQQWLEEVQLLMTPEEMDAFLSLRRDYQREAFIRHFWRTRDPSDHSGRNELRDRWLARVQAARSRYGSLEDDRARVLLLHGPPHASFAVTCAGGRHPAEVWYYGYTDSVDRQVILVFVQRRPELPATLWRTSTFASTLTLSQASQCVNGARLASILTWIQNEAFLEYEKNLRLLLEPPPAPGSEWVKEFLAFSTDLPDRAGAFEADLVIEYGGRHQSRTRSRGLITVPVDEAAVADLTHYRSYNFLLTGEVVRSDRLLDRFRYKFDYPVETITGDRIPVVFERSLRPGDYTLLVRLEDLNSGRFWRQELGLTVPRPNTPRESARPRAAVHRADRRDANLELLRPHHPVLAGLVRVGARLIGTDAERVDFFLDGKPVMSKQRPPYSVELDLGRLPRPRALRAVARDASGNEVARDEVILNSGDHHLRVRLLEPRAGRTGSDPSRRARAEVSAPEGRRVERVEFYLDDVRLSTLYEPPFLQPLPSTAESTYVRAVAYLADGSSAEDLVFLEAPGYLERIDVQLVELYATVLDRRGRPVVGLEREDFRVLEAGQPQELARFEQVEDLPMHAVVLLDTSASMRPRLSRVRAAALGFFERALGEVDRAAIVTFDRLPNLAVGFTNDLTALAKGLAGLRAERGTALYDSLLYTLGYFDGIKGQRVVLLLSDGLDQDSRMGFEEALEYSRRAGVTVYVIGVDLRDDVRDARRRLSALAEETGGRTFFLDDITELDGVYATIEEEIRSQYLLAYQSSNPKKADGFRSVEVELAQQGLVVNAPGGYYP